MIVTVPETLYKQFCEQHRLPIDFSKIAERWYVPLAESLAKHQNSAGKSLLVGVNGCQGSGKSTLTDFLVTVFNDVYGLRAISLSLDDFYLSRESRQVLAEQVHPLFATRGVPGTHNVDRMSLTVKELSNAGYRVAIPRFNKATDNPFPPEQWPVVDGPIDILLVEGWCLGAPPQTEEQLQEPVNELEAVEDENGDWRRFVNLQLARDYQPFFAQLDAWIMLKAPGFDCVYRWRLEQEQKLATRSPEGTAIMSEAQIARFIQHYQRLTEQCFREMPAQMNYLFDLDQNRQIVALTTPRPLL